MKNKRTFTSRIITTRQISQLSPLNQSINQREFNQEVNQSINQLDNQSISQSNNQSINRLNKEEFDQSINQSTDSPRKLSNQAISSNAVTTKNSAFFSSIFVRTSATFSFQSFPAYCKSSTQTLLFGCGGRSSHTKSTKFCCTATSRFPPIPKSFTSVSHEELDKVVGSAPTTEPNGSLPFNHCPNVGLSGSRSFTSTQLSSSCCSACKKYRPSVHKAAWCRVITAVPAEPVKPEINSRRLSAAAMYSFWWASSVGTIKACKEDSL